MSNREGKKSRADIAREYMIEHSALARANAGLPPPEPAMPPRFPSDPEARTAILEAIARGNPKYAKPFDKGTMAHVSLIGTESWSDYGAVVLQMAMLDTLLSIEGKLGALLDRLERRSEVNETAERPGP